jgi:hypothetical protein
MNRARGRGACVLAFFLSFFALLSSGRIASVDAGQQLQVSTLLATTGRLSDDGATGGPANAAWVRAPNGRLYQPHDIGNVILMLPAAWLGARLSAASALEDAQNPPALSRVGVSLTCSCVAAFACYWLFRLFTLYTDERTAFLLALAFPATTIFIAYARAAWDVLPAASLMCAVLYCSASLLRGIGPGWRSVMLAVALACVCSFRFSAAPFIVPAAAAVVALARRKIPPTFLVASALAFAVLIAPSLAYNFVRTGSILRPATATAQYLSGNNALTGNIVLGFYGLFASPNRGLLLFSPILLLAIAVPFLWSRLSADQRALLICYGAGSFGYVLLISKMANWGAFGWGPRYLVPILPVVFAAAAIAIVQAGAPLRPIVIGLACVSALLTIPPAIVNWHLATTTFPGAADPYAVRPYQQIAGWKTLGLGIRGASLPVAADVSEDPVRATTGLFPDLLLARIARQSAGGLILAVMATIAAVAVASRCAARALAAP